MPAPGQMAPHRDNAHFAKMLEALQSKGEPDLAREVAELRKEIAALRAELAPVPSLIVTGRQALDEFKRLAPNVAGNRLARHGQSELTGVLGGSLRSERNDEC